MNMFGCPHSSGTCSSDLLFENDADQEHYLTVMTDLPRWRSRTPSPISASHSVNSSLTTPPSSNRASLLTRMESKSNSVSEEDQQFNNLDDNVFCDDQLNGQVNKCPIIMISDEGSPDNLSAGKESTNATMIEAMVTNQVLVQEKPDFTLKRGASDEITAPSTESRVASAIVHLSPTAHKKVMKVDTLEDAKMTQSRKNLVVSTLKSSKAATLSRACKFGGYFRKIPDGGEVTVSELREMASRQQHQIENQQQLLVAREQRLKYLKMQEGKAAQVNMETEKLRRLRERVEAQEAKLRRLRALRGQVDSSGLSAASLSSDLDAMRNLFSEKEKELVMAAAKVDELTRQLEDLRNGRGSMANNNSGANHLQKHHLELDKLRRELLYRNSVNREASARVVSQQESLTTRKEEINRIDKRIAELQQRLQKKRVLNQQLATQISAATQAKQAHLKAVQQKELREGKRENATDDIATDEHRAGDGLSEFERGKQDPKYQTLPYNTKFSSAGRSGRHGYDYSPDHSSQEESSIQYSNSESSATSNTPSIAVSGSNNNSALVTRTVHSIPTHPTPKNHASAPETNSTNPVQSSGAPGTNGHHNIMKGAPVINNASRQNFVRPHQDLLKPAQTTMTAAQDNRGALPVTSLSLSFSQKLSPGVTSFSQNRFNQQLIKEADTTGLLGHPIGNDILGKLAEGDTRVMNLGKPQLPPKPPLRPTPPPRQKGEPASFEVMHVSPHRVGQTRPQQAFRYASQNVIMSTYTQKAEHQKPEHQKPEQPIHPLPSDSPFCDNSGLKPDGMETVEKVHISSNRRIEMPPDFLFPESHPPPYDLLGRSEEEYFIPSSENLHVNTTQTTVISYSVSQTSSSTTPSTHITSTPTVSQSVKSSLPSPQPVNNDSTHSRIGSTIGSHVGYSGPLAAHSKFNDNKQSQPEINSVLSSNQSAINSSSTLSSNITFNSQSDSNSSPNIETNGGINMSDSYSTDSTDDCKHIPSFEVKKVPSLSEDKEIFEPPKNEPKGTDVIISTPEDNSTDDPTNNNEPVVENNNITVSITQPPETDINNGINRRIKKGNLKTNNGKTIPRRVSFDPLALLLDASLEGELDLVKKTAKEVPNPSAANDEGITALHNAICAGHLDIVTFLVMYGYDVNAQDADGWTPLHCAASCNNVQMARFLVDHGACVLSTTLLDHETAAEKCEQEEDGFDSCSQYLYSVQEKLGIMNGGIVYGVYDFESQNDDEISFKNGEAITVLRRGDEYERHWWWSRLRDKCGYIPRNLLGLYPRVKNPLRES